MTKHDYINYWKSTAEKDWLAANDLFKTNHYLHALFFAHLVLEKLLKAHWVKDHTGDHPPRIHNLVSIADKTKLVLTNADRKFLERMNTTYQLEGRYPDYQSLIYKMVNHNLASATINEVQKIRKWLLKQLP